MFKIPTWLACENNAASQLTRHPLRPAMYNRIALFITTYVLFYRTCFHNMKAHDAPLRSAASSFQGDWCVKDTRVTLVATNNYLFYKGSIL